MTKRPTTAIPLLPASLHRVPAPALPCEPALPDLELTVSCRQARIVAAIDILLLDGLNALGGELTKLESPELSRLLVALARVRRDVAVGAPSAEIRHRRSAEAEPQLQRESLDQWNARHADRAPAVAD